MCDRARAVASRPRWGVLYGVTLPQLAALAASELSGPPNALRTALRFVLALGTFAGMAIWIQSSRAAFDLENWCECAGQKLTVRVIGSRRPRPPVEAVPAAVEPEYEVVG